LDLAQRSAELFQSSKPELQQKLLDYLLSNILLDDKKLDYSLSYPFSEFAKQNKKPRLSSEPFLWQAIAEDIRTYFQNPNIEITVPILGPLS
jgi:hypothetical protein